MRILPILSAVFLTAVTPASAQVTLDLHALQALPDHRETIHTSRAAPPAVRKPAAMATREVPATSARPTSTPAAQPALPAGVPETATVAPIVAPPATSASQPSPPPPPVSAKAGTVAAPTTAGLRLTFAPGQSDLSPASSTSIKQLTDTTPTGDDTTFNILAYAPGKPDDPSTARRISLSRAMAVRSALVADGVPSARIFVRALGEQYGDGPPDRVDLDVTGAPGDKASSNMAPNGTVTTR